MAKIRNLIRMVKRRIYLNSKVRPKQTSRMGNEYGGFDVCSLGLVGRHIVVYSFGIGEDISFTKDILNNYDAEVYAFDPTPKSVEFVEKSAVSKSTSFHFCPIGLSDKNEKTMFYLPQNDDYVSGSSVITDGKKETAIEVEMKNISTIMSDNGHRHIDILKMDIEGSEFKVVDEWTADRSAGDTKWELSIDQICVEVHDRMLVDGFDRLVSLVEGLEGLGYELISISDTYEELTFFRNREDMKTGG